MDTPGPQSIEQYQQSHNWRSGTIWDLRIWDDWNRQHIATQPTANAKPAEDQDWHTIYQTAKS